MSCLVVFVEENSAKALLDLLLPRIVPEGMKCRVIPFEGKSDLEAQLVKRLRGWREPDSCFIVLRDQDSGDCRLVKARLAALCDQAGKAEAMVRIACHELESWYLGDLAAVEASLELTNIARQEMTSKFRDPDRLNNAAQELSALTRGAYQKVGGSRRIAPHLDLTGENRSKSFRVFCDGVRRICAS